MPGVPDDLEGLVWFAHDALCIEAPRRAESWIVPGVLLVGAVLTLGLAPWLAFCFTLGALVLGMSWPQAQPYRIAAGRLSGPDVESVRPEGPVRLTGAAGARMHLFVGELMVLTVRAADGSGGVAPASLSWLGERVADRLGLPLEDLRDVAEMERFATDPAYREACALAVLQDRSRRSHPTLHAAEPREPMGEVSAAGARYWVAEVPLDLDLRQVGGIALQDLDEVALVVEGDTTMLVVLVGADRRTLLSGGLEVVPELLFLERTILDARARIRPQGTEAEIPAALARLDARVQSERR